MLSLACIVLVLLITIRLYQYWQKQRRIVKYVNKINGPTALPIIGHLHIALCTPQELIRKVVALSTLFKSPTKIWIFNQPLIGVFSPQDIQAVGSKCLDKHDLFRTMSILIGDGLITANGQKWKRSRNIVGSSFNLSVMSKNFLGVFNRHNLHLIKRFQNMPDTQFDLWPCIFKTYYDLITETAMGHSDSIDEKEFLHTRENFEKACQLIFYRFVRPWLWPTFFFKLYLYLTGRQNIISSCQNLPLKILKERRKIFAKQRSNNEHSKDDGPEKSCDNLIDSLLSIKEHQNRLITDQEIIDEVLTIQFAGSETTALTTCFTLLMLAIHLDIQDKVHLELDQIFGHSNRGPTIEDIASMKYLEQCIKESLRKFSVAPASMRVASEDVILSGGTTIPAGANIVPMYCLVHLDRSQYSNPGSWNPAHFDPEQEAKRPPGSFVPFGTGPRMCVGYKYAMLAMKAQISTILRQFKLTTTLRESEIVISVDILCRSVNGFPVKLHAKK